MSGLQELGSSGHGVDDELDTLGGGDADLEHAAGGVDTYQHVQVVEIEHSDRVSVGVLAKITGSTTINLP
jgi:hypothetical protein